MTDINNKKTVGMRITELLELQDKLHQEISDSKEKLDNVQRELNALADQIKTTPTQDSTMALIAHGRDTGRDDNCKSSSPPPKGIVTDMIKVMQEFNAPMKTELIFDEVAKIRPDTKIASVRSYLTNLDFFENIKLKDIKAGTTSYTSPGWVLSEKAKSIEVWGHFPAGLSGTA